MSSAKWRYNIFILQIPRNDINAVFPIDTIAFHMFKQLFASMHRNTACVYLISGTLFKSYGTLAMLFRLSHALLKLSCFITNNVTPCFFHRFPLSQLYYRSRIPIIFINSLPHDLLMVDMLPGCVSCQNHPYRCRPSYLICYACYLVITKGLSHYIISYII